MNNKPTDGTSQRQKFEDLARELEADEDEARFEETVRKIGPKAPPQYGARDSGD